MAWCAGLCSGASAQPFMSMGWLCSGCALVAHGGSGAWLLAPAARVGVRLRRARVSVGSGRSVRGRAPSSPAQGGCGQAGVLGLPGLWWGSASVYNPPGAGGAPW